METLLIKALSELAFRMTGSSRAELEGLIADYIDIQVVYRSAIRDIQTRLEVLDDEFQFRHRRNPIRSIQTRLKSPQSMVEKIVRRNLVPEIGVVRSEITDIAGIRVICSYLDDIYHLADLLCGQKGVRLLRTHDYIKEPKASGYRSLHIVVEVPVFFSSGMQKVPVEIQIRTIAMDFWASLEHELRYKSAADITQEMVLELKDCAEQISILDKRMQKVYKQLETLDASQQQE